MIADSTTHLLLMSRGVAKNARRLFFEKLMRDDLVYSFLVLVIFGNARPIQHFKAKSLTI
jgi:hypothetical protein